MRTSSRQSTAHAPRIAVVASSLALVLTSPVLAQDGLARVGPVKGAVIKGGPHTQLVFCLASNASAADYRLKVWQLMKGQSGVDAVASNPVIATTTYHAINTKGAGSGDRPASPPTPELATACAAALQSPAPVTADAPLNAEAPRKTRTKSNNSNDRMASSAVTTDATIAVPLERFPVCARGRTCRYAWTVEPVAEDGKKGGTLATSVQVPYEFSIAPDGTIATGSSGRD